MQSALGVYLLTLLARKEVSWHVQDIHHLHAAEQINTVVWSFTLYVMSARQCPCWAAPGGLLLHSHQTGHLKQAVNQVRFEPTIHPEELCCNETHSYGSSIDPKQVETGTCIL
jgi:hypothetical protein